MNNSAIKNHFNSQLILYKTLFKHYETTFANINFTCLSYNGIKNNYIYICTIQKTIK
jgi:hypothetical protein